MSQLSTTYKIVSKHFSFTVTPYADEVITIVDCDIIEQIMIICSGSVK